MTTKLLTDDFIDKYPDFPSHMNALGTFVYYRTYSRFLPQKGRRETWKETVRRATDYNVGLGVKHMEKIGYAVDYDAFRKEAEALFDSMFNLRQFLSGRTLWVGGADGGVAEKYPLANFNCSFVNIRSWSDLGDLFYLLLVGTGVGFKCTKEFAAELAPIRTNFTLYNESYDPVAKHERIEHTETREISDTTLEIVVGDSKEGWVEALRYFFAILTDKGSDDYTQIIINYDSVRPNGERLNTFGGTASGPEPLMEMFEGIERVLKNEIDPNLDVLETIDGIYSKVRPVHILDIGNLIGNNVVVGGVRRTAEIFLMDADDYESIFAKYGINGVWNEQQHRKIIEKVRALGLRDIVRMLESLPINDPNARPLHHRRMSNNSIAFTEKPSEAMLDLVFEMMQMEGEPGFVNLEEARRRRPNAEGLNPCVEIILDSYGVCNLTTVNMAGFVEDGNLNVEKLKEAQRLSARAGLRMTLAELELPHWNAIQQRDRLLGTSLTGVKDALAMVNIPDVWQAPLDYEKALLQTLKIIARKEADNYAKELRVSSPLLVTTVKPEGTISQVAGGVSSGLHWSHSPYYIRRIRINAADPLAKAVQSIGWPVFAEVGTAGHNDEAELAKPEIIAQARTLVIEFPIASGATKTKDDVYVPEQFDTYFRFQRHYTEHNSSNTIHVRPDEWGKAQDIVYDGWDDFVGVSFLAYDGGTYRLAPYEAITKERYEEMVAKLAEFDPSILQRFETGEDGDLDGMGGCEGGVCPIR
ncbi:ribonucleoside-triphosphate reductase, adenosylcobalamin-dependent [Cytobacillus purgationiresistens]|uniref:Adenosylcobalamin-dependent ribonucleoside-triphosphate reductase n=1 Tax=Cytobacillus purgationiresistens TaxID=863449 RepID=A0ABU0AHM8_9BACI|nr:ribonucleoside-triphosphate reductase, adenosylcobalamin-dependent [Cytobacillus purgationiresistens]MDQ0270762.1 ribonucleoside-diphosphate reductase alpha chain/ribonucleoside-triphosphate reductase [Cytobacillus purgationiresistens]